ncbi:MAG: ATP-binding protein [Eubacterium sp.]|nr:ATP-binding protein [Eubacterium sp.]MDE6752755.1 ATP-binding protein [Eubacterium sp.]
MSMFDDVMRRAMARQNSEYGVYNDGDFYKDIYGYSMLHCKQCKEQKQTLIFRSLYSYEEQLQLEENYAINHQTLSAEEVHNAVMNLVPPKNKRIDLGLVGVPCKCQRDYHKGLAKAEKDKDRQAAIRKNQIECFPVPKMRTETFDKYKENKHIRTAKEYEKKFAEMYANGKGLVLCGKAGAGKTIAAICLANALLQREFKVLFKMQQEIAFCDINERFEMMETLISCSILIIDDLNLETCKEYGNELLFYIIDGRVKRGKPTIITTNHTKEAIMDASDVDNRLFSRIVESSYIVEDSKNDYRRKA